MQTIFKGIMTVMWRKCDDYDKVFGNSSHYLKGIIVITLGT